MAPQQHPQSWNEWFDAECERQRAEDDPQHIEQLVEPHALPGTYGWLRRRPPKTPRKQAESRTLRGILSRSCSGWPEPPDAIEAEKAIKGRTATRRTEAVVETVLCESQLHELMQGEQEQAWSLQDLCWWMHELKIRRADLVSLLNAFSEEFVLEKVREMKTLTLPKPARNFWQTSRPVLDTLMPSSEGWRRHLSGGTILAVQLEHRESTDIDIVVTGGRSRPRRTSSPRRTSRGTKSAAIAERRERVGHRHHRPAVPHRPAAQ